MASKFEDLVAYQLAAELADAVWPVVLGWPSLARWTVGKQLLRSADSVGANIAEATGRRTSADRRYFFAVARGSALETKHWLLRAKARGLDVPQVETDRLVRVLAGLVNAETPT